MGPDSLKSQHEAYNIPSANNAMLSIALLSISPAQWSGQHSFFALIYEVANQTASHEIGNETCRHCKLLASAIECTLISFVIYQIHCIPNQTKDDGTMPIPHIKVVELGPNRPICKKKWKPELPIIFHIYNFARLLVIWMPPTTIDQVVCSD